MPRLPDQYVWFAWALTFDLTWLLCFVALPRLRGPMGWVSLCTVPFAATEVFFVGSYWNPPSLLNLAHTQGWDIESYLFCFGVGGVAAVLYNVVFRQPLRIPRKTWVHGRRQQWYVLALLFPFLAYLPLYGVTGRPLWTGVGVMAVGAATRAVLYPELRVKTFAGGVLFVAYYGAFLALLAGLAPGYINRVWVRSIPGGSVFGVPWAELAFGLSLGMFWSGIYEQIVWIFSLPAGKAPAPKCTDRAAQSPWLPRGNLTSACAPVRLGRQE